MSGKATYADWIAVDWGTSNLRCWAMRDASPIDDAQSDRGMSTLSRAEFEPALLELIDPWLGNRKTLVVACGMVGSRQGWAEAPYNTIPCKPLAENLAVAPTSDPRLSVQLIPGLRQTSHPDVMRGEETQIAGFLKSNPQFDGVLCMPGTHTKWVHVSAGEIVSFRTFMTGEFFSLLSKFSVLKHSTNSGWDDQAFGEALADSLARPEALAGNLFSIRADDLLNTPAPGVLRARLSGHLIGAELAASRPYWLGQNVALIGADELSRLYGSALAVQGVQAQVADATEATLAGLSAASQQMREATT